MSKYFHSDNYIEIKEKFESSSKSGYNHIQFWIVSNDFYAEYINDTNRMKGSRILLNPILFDFTKYNHASIKIAGYDIVISTKFESKYGIKPVLFKGLDEVDLRLLSSINNYCGKDINQ